MCKIMFVTLLFHFQQMHRFCAATSSTATQFQSWFSQMLGKNRSKEAASHLTPLLLLRGGPPVVHLGGLPLRLRLPLLLLVLCGVPAVRLPGVVQDSNLVALGRAAASQAPVDGLRGEGRNETTMTTLNKSGEE